MKLPSIAAALFLAGCAATTAPIVSSAPIVLTEPQVAAVKQGVAVALKDPDSVRFGGLTAARSADGQIYVCGMVNAKNSFGGYVGNKPYLGILNGTIFAVVGVGGSDIETATVYSECRRYGVNI